jgi:glycosyltransferase involved in cell wall biosynthesis
VLSNGFSAPVASVVIPAYDEEAVIGGVLEALLRDARAGELEVIVVANGCHDRTAEVARSFGDRVQVVETPVGSKPGALNLGDRHATAFPRVYLDADIPLDTASVRRLAALLDHDDGAGGALVASPTMRMDVSGRPWSVRAYYRIWVRLPYVADAHLAAVIGISRAGRARFGEFPDVVADDLYVRGQFLPEERRRLDDCEYVVQAPRALRSLVRVKTRSFAGGMQLAQRFPDVAARGRGRGGVRARLTALARDPRLWPALGCYTYVWGAARARAWWDLRFGRDRGWHRDDTTREGAPLA